jgi:hypothetical protein
VSGGSGAATRALATAAVAIAAVSFVAHASVAMNAGHLDCVSGIWLALGRDVEAGHFYRPLISDLGYGGTRYFPLFFLLIGGFLRLGAGILTAGWLASGVAALILAGGMYSLVRRLDGARWMAALFAAAALAPYFVQQTLVEIRADVLAAAFNVWGLAFVLPAWRVDSTGDEHTRPGWAAVAFTLAFATKVTSLAIPVALVAAAFGARRRPLAWAVLWRFAAGAAVFLAVTILTSNGRALESWRACMFAGAGLADMLRAFFAGDFVVLTRYSRLLAALFVVTVSAMVAAAWWAARHAIRPDASRSLLVPAAIFAGASVSAGLLLSSPGTVASNHIVEWIEIALVVIALVACTQSSLSRPLAVATAALMLWASMQDLRQARDLWNGRPDAQASADIDRFLADVRAAQGPVLAESAVWPLLAGREVALLDPFALRVVMDRRPDIARDLLEKIDRQAFPLVIFQVDPTSDAGRGYYTHLNLGWPATERVLARYRLASHPRDDVFVYVPRVP